MQAAKLGSAVLGFVFAVAAVALDDPRLGWAAIALLSISFVVRAITRRRSTTDQ
jgi:hypothetical protein